MNRYRNVGAIVVARASKPGSQERSTRKRVLEVNDRKRMLEVDDRKRVLEVSDRKRVLEVNPPERVVEAGAQKLAGGTIAAEPASDRRARKRISRSQQFKRRPSLVNDQ